METTITLEGYNDIFDDFDPRPFNERSISADFVNLLQERIRKVDFSTHMTIVLTLPKRDRVEREERIIEKRLKDHFRGGTAAWKDRGRELVLESMKYIVIGLAIYVAGGLLNSYVPALRQYMLIPAWFLTWRAVELLILDYPKTTAKRQFYTYMGNSMITFKNEGYYKA